MNPLKRITTYFIIASLFALSACVIGRGGWGRHYDHDDGSRDGDSYRRTLAYQERNGAQRATAWYWLELRQMKATATEQSQQTDND
jgi:hypothetical protein